MPVNRQLIHPNKDEFRFCSVCLSLFSVFFSFPFSGGRYRPNKMHQIFWNILHSILNTFWRIWINSNARNQHLRAEWILVQNDWQFDEAAILVASPRAIRNELRKRKPRLPLKGIWINSNARNQHLRAEWILVQNDWQFDEAAILVASPRAIRNELRKRKPRLPLKGIKCKTTDTRGLR